MNLEMTSIPEWYLMEGAVPTGPFKYAQVSTRLVDGTLLPNTISCPVGSSEWKPLEQWSAFSGITKQPQQTLGGMTNRGVPGMQVQPSPPSTDNPRPKATVAPANLIQDGSIGGILIFIAGISAVIMLGFVLRSWLGTAQSERLSSYSRTAVIAWRQRKGILVLLGGLGAALAAFLTHLKKEWK